MSLLGKPSFKKKSILRKSFIKRWPPSPVGVLWKLIFFGLYFGAFTLYCKKIEVWNPDDVKLFRIIDFFLNDGFPKVALIRAGKHAFLWRYGIKWHYKAGFLLVQNKIVLFVSSTNWFSSYCRRFSSCLIVIFVLSLNLRGKLRVCDFLRLIVPNCYKV